MTGHEDDRLGNGGGIHGGDGGWIPRLWRGCSLGTTGGEGGRVSRGGWLEASMLGGGRWESMRGRGGWTGKGRSGMRGRRGWTGNGRSGRSDGEGQVG